MVFDFSRCASGHIEYSIGAHSSRFCGRCCATFEETGKHAPRRFSCLKSSLIALSSTRLSAIYNRESKSFHITMKKPFRVLDIGRRLEREKPAKRATLFYNFTYMKAKSQ